MLPYTLRKIAHTTLVALGVVTLAFLALRLSGDPAATMLPGDASVEELGALRRELGLDRGPAWRFLGADVARHQQRHRCEHEMRGAIRPRTSELEGDIAGAGTVQAVTGQGWPKGVPADALEAVALTGRDPHARMEIEALPARVTRRRRQGRQGARIAQTRGAPPLGVRHRQSLHGGRRPPRQERLGLRKRIRHILPSTPWRWSSRCTARR
jgi:hypothetical protein